MSRDAKTKKKSTSKYRNQKISPLIPIVAIIEVLVLIVASTFAWFTISVNKQAGTGIITVDADSGLDIDFKYANTTDTINIWNYINDDFAFEPASSIDGRNIYFPTSGTFGGSETNDIVFREGTVNDINTKYLSIDFELTNTSSDIMDVYLKNSSRFTVKKNGNDVDSRALRMAFYPNDGSQGDVRSDMFGDSGATSSAASNDMITIYYDNWNRDGAPYVYVWNSSSENGSTDQTYTELAAYPGSKMTHVGDSIYSFTFNKNYDMCVFNNGGTGDANKLTGNMYTIDDQIYYGAGYTRTQLSTLATVNNNNDVCGVTGTRDPSTNIMTYSPDRATFETTFSANKYKYSKNTKTVYFMKPSNNSSWANAYCYIWDTEHNNTVYRSWPGAQMNYIGADVYSYTYYSPATASDRVVGEKRTYNKIIFNCGYDENEQDSSKRKKSDDTDLTSVENRLYYFSSGDSGSMNNTAYNAQINTVYFYNTLGWDKPYIKATFSANNNSTQDIALSTLTGNVYYCTVPAVYTSLYFYNKTDSKRTVDVNPIRNGYIYRPTGVLSGTKYKLDSFSYDNYTSDGAYAVISPGVSAGFQRSYNPVVAINNVSGDAIQFVPAFSDSIDNYIYGSGNPLFTIQPNHMISLSMIVWLEGTDADCNDDYSQNNIDIYLALTTLNRTNQHVYNNSDTPNYKYRFVDATREVWTSDRLSTESGVTVSPVMQLYDTTNSRGYLMKAAGTTDYQGNTKVNIWECYAPASIATSNLEFRRVNPYNESEIWNFWHCGPLKVGNNVYPGAMTLSTDETDDDNQKQYINIATFTAFSDGAPASMSTGSSGSTTTPTDSCGGLWGDFSKSTTTLTMIDGTGGQSIKNATTKSTALTINYTYTYSNGMSKTIEYKASGPYKDAAYYFVVPDTIIKSTTNLAAASGTYKIYFKKYDNFDTGYAMNIPSRNSAISYSEQYPITDDHGIRGKFGYLASTSATYNYWGSDVIYVQAQYHLKQHGFLTNTQRIHFFVNSSYNADANDKYVEIFNNNQFNVSGGQHDYTLGYACVVPCNRQYYGYRVECASNATSSGTIYNTTEGYNFETRTDLGGGYYDIAVGQNIATCDYFKYNIYFNKGGFGNEYNNSVKVHYWTTDTGLDKWVDMDNTGYYDSGQIRWHATIPADVNIQIQVNGSIYSKDWNNPGNGKGFYPSSWDGGAGKFNMGSYDVDQGAYSAYGSIHCAYNNSPDWP